MAYVSMGCVSAGRPQSQECLAQSFSRQNFRRTCFVEGTTGTDDVKLIIPQPQMEFNEGLHTKWNLMNQVRSLQIGPETKRT
ncbi:uncharacterized protein LAJ45_01246 [Morchella importuna]|uniref:uncharacterized protein n=1 Tax=Morchella importuna TaxID=1174673 RepID=UPI001E8D018F|nr:uncharacterized protein LAJ45_01246 [Morchella importuna]KAH8154715.1 hypothetical protein LAJ45_01246 [Morchella importuna]